MDLFIITTVFPKISKNKLECEDVKHLWIPLIDLQTLEEVVDHFSSYGCDIDEL